MVKTLIRPIQKNKRNNQRSITLPSKLFKPSNKAKKVKITIEEWLK